MTHRKRVFISLMYTCIVRDIYEYLICYVCYLNLDYQNGISINFFKRWEYRNKILLRYTRGDNYILTVYQMIHTLFMWNKSVRSVDNAVLINFALARQREVKLLACVIYVNKSHRGVHFQPVIISVTITKRWRTKAMQFIARVLLRININESALITTVSKSWNGHHKAPSPSHLLPVIWREHDSN